MEIGDCAGSFSPCRQPMLCLISEDSRLREEARLPSQDTPQGELRVALHWKWEPWPLLLQGF